ncbi:amino acid transporter heavy chain SLC3A2 [Synchiropus picturatus]
MPLNAGDSGYGAVSVPAMSASADVTEAAPLLVPQPGAEEEAWRPMTKEELERKAGGPRWAQVRFYLVLLFWVTWLVMFIASIVIVILSPRPVVTPLKWWQKSLFYQLQPEMYMDAQSGRSEGINALCVQLPHLKSLGIGALILEGLFHQNKSSTNLTGDGMETWPQIRHLLGESNKAGLRVVLDFCHVEFSESVEDAGERSDRVQNTLRFWLRHGVAGFAICDTDATFSEKTLLMWRDVLGEFNHEEERIIVLKQTTDVLPSFNVSGQNNVSLVDIVMRSLLPSSPKLLSGNEVAAAIGSHLQKAEDGWPSWTVGGHASNDLNKLLLVLTMTLPGSPAVQYDEETERRQNYSINVGSSPKESNGTMSNTDQNKDLSSVLFTSLSHTRAREEALQYGTFTFLPFSSGNSSLSSPPILAFLRSWGCVHFLVLLNVGPHLNPLDPVLASSLPEGGVFMASTGMDRRGSTSLNKLKLRPHEAVVIKLFESAR